MRARSMDEHYFFFAGPAAAGCFAYALPAGVFSLPAPGSRSITRTESGSARFGRGARGAD